MLIEMPQNGTEDRHKALIIVLLIMYFINILFSLHIFDGSSVKDYNVYTFLYWILIIACFIFTFLIYMNFHRAWIIFLIIITILYVSLFNYSAKIIFDNLIHPVPTIGVYPGSDLSLYANIIGLVYCTIIYISSIIIVIIDRKTCFSHLK